MRYPAGTSLLVLILLAWTGLEWSRPLLPSREAPPAPVVWAGENWLFLGAGWPEPGAHQFSDGQTVRGVIRLTGLPLATHLTGDPCLEQSLDSGRALELLVEDAVIVDVFLFWMPAGQRMALGIPLHPERMTRSDWRSLPGIGETLAARIEKDRQENGDFGSLEALKRVRGIGKGRIRAWREFFQ